MQIFRFLMLGLFLFAMTVPVRGRQPIDIAPIYALTGSAAEANAFALRGVGHAVIEINARGGIIGRKLNLLVFDNQSTPIGSTLAVRLYPTVPGQYI